MMRLFVILIAAWTTACGASHVASYKEKRREIDPNPIEAHPDPEGASLMVRGQWSLYEDPRAKRIGDLVIIRIDEAETASREANTRLDKKGSSEYGVPNAFGLMEGLRGKLGGLDPSKLLATDSRSSFDGAGRMNRQGRLNATLPVRVRKLLPNGDMFVEGTKVIMVSNEEHHLYVSGIVRPIDIGPDGAVPSSRVADAEIEYTGRGDASDQQRPGFFSRMLAKLWPF